MVAISQRTLLIPRLVLGCGAGLPLGILCHHLWRACGLMEPGQPHFLSLET